MKRPTLLLAACALATALPAHALPEGCGLPSALSSPAEAPPPRQGLQQLLSLAEARSRAVGAARLLKLLSILGVELVCVDKWVPVMAAELVERVNADPRRGMGHENMLTRIEIDLVLDHLGFITDLDRAFRLGGHRQTGFHQRGNHEIAECLIESHRGRRCHIQGAAFEKLIGLKRLFGSRGDIGGYRAPVLGRHDLVLACPQRLFGRGFGG